MNIPKNKLEKITKVIVHPGDAHSDEIIACGIAVMCGANPHSIVRCVPTQEDLEDKNVLVLDIGGVWDPELMCFDHHQFHKDSEPDCSYTLLAKYLGLEETMKMVFPWYFMGAVKDSKGPKYVSDLLNCDTNMYLSTCNPLINYIVDDFKCDDTRSRAVQWISKYLETTLNDFNMLMNNAEIIHLCGLKFGKILNLEKDYPILEASLAFQKEKNLSGVIMKDNRGNGYKVIRYNDDPRVDFSKCFGNYVQFKHANGFVATTKHASWLEVESLIFDAVK